MRIVDPKIRTRIVIGCSVLALLFCILSGRLLYIELCHGEELDRKARAHYEYKEELPAQRGRILDRNGELLARNQTVYTLVVDCHHLRDQGLATIGLGKQASESPQTIRKRFLPDEILSRYREYVADSIAPVLRVPKQEIARKLRSKTVGEIVLAKGIEDDFASQVEKVLDEKRLGGLYLRRGERRFYPSPLSLTQVIGYVNQEGEGESGIEKRFDEEMSGRPGYRYSERDNRRREIHAYRGLQVDPVPGKDVHLTIDMALQAIVERELDSVIDRFRPEKVTAIWMDPRNGQVLAMSSRPHFDLSTRDGIRGMPAVRRNIAISDLYQPGSTFKIVGYGAAFDRGMASPGTEIDCHMGEYDLDGFLLKDHHPYGRMPAQMAFAKSSNIAAYLIARPLGKNVFHYYMHQFGFGQDTGIELTAETGGLVYPVSKWTKTSFSSQTMGYEVSVTPLQVAVACGIIANNGVLRPPTILKGIEDHSVNGEGFVKADARASRRVISEKAASQVRRCMIEAMMDHGTGSKGAVAGYSMAGKTGTARKHVENVGYVKGRYIASFMGFLPADDPQLLGLIVIDDPKVDEGAVYGGSVAAPIFRAIAEDAVKVLKIQPDQPEQLQAPEDPAVIEISAAGGAQTETR